MAESSASMAAPAQPPPARTTLPTFQPLTPTASTSTPLDRRPSRTSTLRETAKHFPYWILPLVSAFIWFGQLWILIIVWLAANSPHYGSMAPAQTIAYISDIGADTLRPLFITGCALTSIFFFTSLCVMQRNHALVRRLERHMDTCSIVAGFIGSVALVLLAIFDTMRYSTLHRLFLALFMLGVCLSALFTTVQYRRLGKTYTEHSVIKWSYRGKQAIVVVEIALSVAFGVCMGVGKHNAAAIIEWLIAFVFTFYVLSFFFDLRPKARTKEVGGVRKLVGRDGREGERAEEREDERAEMREVERGESQV